jgi:hypothetical protein
MRLYSVITLATLLVAATAQASPPFFDNFDNSYPGEPALLGTLWPKWPNATDHLNLYNNHNHSPGGTNSVRQDPEDPYTLANYHDFGPVSAGVVATAWLWDDYGAVGNATFPVNMYIGLYGDSTNGPTADTDYLLLGLSPTFADFNTYGYNSLTGGIGNTGVQRTNAIAGSVDHSGWIKLTIHADSLDRGGQVRFYINDALVGTTSREPGVALRYFFMGSQSKNYEFFWYDDVSVAGIPEITGITVSGGTVTINFIGDSSDLASIFTLTYALSVNGDYTPAAATITGSGGSYQATVQAPSGDQTVFYRIER